MTAKLSVRWVVGVGILALVLTAVISGTLLAILGYPVISKVKDTFQGVWQRVGPRPAAPADADAAKVRELQAKVDELQAQLDQAKRQLEQARSSNSVPGSAAPGATQAAGATPAGRQASRAPVAANSGSPPPDFSQMYASMAPARAAAILQQMRPVEAALILNGLSNEDRGAILEKMDAQTAANLIRTMERIASIVQGLPSPKAVADLARLPKDDQSAVLQKLDPGLAAQVSQQLDLIQPNGG
ncbi:MAG: hypothetical protein QJR06_01365 [Alicyclobacillaceae bacterium]|nr:hypothetical protein [Alicyclobacillaceae bacterium]